jgi:hypothetical protein
MSALASPYFGRAGMSPDDFEPTSKQIKARADYLKPLLLASREDAADLLATQTGTPDWEAFARTLHAGDECEAGKLARKLMDKGAAEESARLASNELHRWRGSDYQYEDMRTLRRIRAIEVWSWLREWER